jgi:hypothetical protein
LDVDLVAGATVANGGDRNRLIAGVLENEVAIVRALSKFA